MHARIIPHQLGYDAYYRTWHANGQNTLIYMHSDGGSIVCKERIYPIEKGVLCFIGSKKYHYTMPDAPVNYDRSKVFMQDSNFHKLLSLLQEDSPLRSALTGDSFIYARIPNKHQADVEALFSEIACSCADPRNGDALYFCAFLKLLTYLDRFIVEGICSPQSQISEAITYINKNIGSDLHIDNISQNIHMSKYHFCRQFKKVTGMTVMEYILKTRLTMATGMLGSEALSVGQIAEQCGFGDTSHFCRAFKAETGLSPLQYRKKAKAKTSG